MTVCTPECVILVRSKSHAPGALLIILCRAFQRHYPDKLLLIKEGDVTDEVMAAGFVACDGDVR